MTRSSPGPGGPGGGGRGRPLCSSRPPAPGPFPSPRPPGWCGWGWGATCVPLTQLFYRLEKAFAALGYPPEGRAFNPHLTLGRVKSPANRERLARLLAKAAAAGLAAVYGEGVDSVSERAVAPGVEIYAVEGDSVGVK